MISVIHHRFRAGRGSTLALILLFPLLLRLGFWQLDRADQKQAIAETLTANRALPVLDIVAASTIPLAQEGRRVTAQGRFVGPNLLLDNRTRAGRAGYEVLTPFRLDDGSRVLVARGWIPVGDNRARVPEIEIPEMATRVNGVLAPPPATGIALGRAQEVEKLTPALWRIQHPDPSVFGGESRAPALGLLLYLDPAEPHGYDRAWPRRAEDISRHHAYATQWFAMAAVLLLLYVRVNVVSRAARTDPR